MAEFKIKCPHCRTAFKAQDEWIGIEVECPSCKQTFMIPERQSGQTKPLRLRQPAVQPRYEQQTYAPQGKMPYGQGQYGPQGQMPYGQGQYGQQPGQGQYGPQGQTPYGQAPNGFQGQAPYGPSPYGQPGQPNYGQPGLPQYGQPQYYGPPKSRTTFILLGIFLGGLGIHNFYAGYTNKGIIQLVITLLTCWFFGSFFIWIWAVVEVCTITVDAYGQPMI